MVGAEWEEVNGGRVGGADNIGREHTMCVDGGWWKSEAGRGCGRVVWGG